MILVMNRRVWLLLPLLVFVAIAGFFAVGLTRDPRAIRSVLINQPVPDFELPPIQGRARGFTSADLRGQVSLVNIFGSWCVACQVEHPFLMKIKERGLVPLHGIDWREEAPDAGPNWLKRYGDPYTLIGDDPRSRAAIAFGVTGAPETFVVDGDAVIRYKHVGPITSEIWDKTLWPLIEELRRESRRP